MYYNVFTWIKYFDLSFGSERPDYVGGIHQCVHNYVLSSVQTVPMIFGQIPEQYSFQLTINNETQEI